MGKSTDKNKLDAPKKAKATVAKSGGLSEIDSLFARKKQSQKELQQQISQEKESAKEERKRRKQARLEEETDEIALRGLAGAAGASVSCTRAAAGPKKGDAIAPAALHEQARKLSSLTYTRSDIEKLNDSTHKEVKNKWATDGLGGVFNGEGYTGRRDDGGHRVFKAHLMNKKGFGESPDCPFDCDCCFI
mmetsp:Transcript_13266/g.28668  ORF Transcript_13266/g.28668 Transcript_13266/m.28668 type:complete len:190 (-) Transcript_13266:109-678(-)|eukprot:CAMPEP_0172551666 /NCGR_PEP_ID=MMETSP1067-20121228/40132_1 /TAXON_ID=265564 ORGANISM="Thalassiosira punctigera, Strain Tpunct2005C2" /NCGR_SAMPLE_ID=MMETSP1067 /ASSEMBLY_ACC=CAM_ASM_000444 /LENGTH=189 /DNA_ID=CAMNT_0013339475 /DNA_START=249 /DNA_END=818 /DNA_ORIENTATION=+